MEVRGFDQSGLPTNLKSDGQESTIMPYLPRKSGQKVRGWGMGARNTRFLVSVQIIVCGSTHTSQPVGKVMWRKAKLVARQYSLY